MGYLISAAEGQTSVNLTDPQWRALVYGASQHGFSAPHLRLEDGEEALDVEAADAERLRSALGKALEARDTEEVRTPDGELAYDTIQRACATSYSRRGRAWPARPSERPANRPIGRVLRFCSTECVEGKFSEVGGLA